jgi:transglutaminase-like putative cysteine protease
MRFSVRHTTIYRYSTPVALAPHVLRLSPRATEGVLGRSIVVSPQPVEQREELDADGNTLTHVAFAPTPTAELFIESTFALETRQPVAPLVGASAPLPWPGTNAAVDPAVAAFARQVAAQAGNDPVAFLNRLCETMHARADKHVRPDGDAQSPTETLSTWRGACRDYTVLFLAAARSLGLVARFVSGYQSAAETPDGRRYLHAWPEVFIPGAGWHGWDPTHGIPVGDGHVALCAAPEQAGTMPVTGGFYFDGPSVTSTLDFDLRVDTM